MTGTFAVPPWRDRRGQEAQYEIKNHCREAPPCGGELHYWAGCLFEDILLSNFSFVPLRKGNSICSRGICYSGPPSTGLWAFSCHSPTQKNRGRARGAPFITAVPILPCCLSRDIESVCAGSSSMAGKKIHQESIRINTS